MIGKMRVLNKKVLAIALGLIFIVAFTNEHKTFAKNNKEATLKNLEIVVPSHSGEKISPKFKYDVNEYTIDVQSDIYGVLVKPVANDFNDHPFNSKISSFSKSIESVKST